MEESDFIGRCPTNVERSISVIARFIIEHMSLMKLLADAITSTFQILKIKNKACIAKRYVLKGSSENFASNIKQIF